MKKGEIEKVNKKSMKIYKDKIRMVWKSNAKLIGEKKCSKKLN